MYRVFQKSVPKPSNSGAAQYTELFINPKSCRKSGLISLSNYRIHTKIFILCLNFITNINIWDFMKKLLLATCGRSGIDRQSSLNGCILKVPFYEISCICKYLLKNSIILNVHNDPCFEDKSLSLTLNNRPVHFFDKAVQINR